MRKTSVLLVVLLTMGSQGCGAFSNARAREKSIVEMYTAAVKSLTAFRNAGKIDDDTWAAIKIAIRAAKGAREAVADARKAGQTETIPVLLDAAIKAMANVIAYDKSYKGEA